MSDLLNKIGIKQTVQRVWMDKTVHMLLAGMSEKEIRMELDQYLSNQKQSGGEGKREGVTYRMAIGLLASWFSPAAHLIAFRDDALALARHTNETAWLPLHWAVMSASYPFWYYVAKQTGRLFNLQDMITQPQVFQRLKEQYGDRETVARNARYTIRSFRAWGAVTDTQAKGCYEKGVRFAVDDISVIGLLYESILYCHAERKLSLGLLQANPALFAFAVANASGEMLVRANNRLLVNRFGLDDEQIVIR